MRMEPHTAARVMFQVLYYSQRALGLLKVTGRLLRHLLKDFGIIDQF